MAAKMTPEEKEQKKRLRLQERPLKLLKARQKKEQERAEKKMLREEVKKEKAKVKLKPEPRPSTSLPPSVALSAFLPVPTAPPRKRSRRVESMPDTEQEVIELLGRPIKGSDLYPKYEDQLVELTVLEIADDLKIPVLDLN